MNASRKETEMTVKTTPELCAWANAYLALTLDRPYRRPELPAPAFTFRPLYPRRDSSWAEAETMRHDARMAEDWG
jgi:hypothetical protein